MRALFLAVVLLVLVVFVVRRRPGTPATTARAGRAARAAENAGLTLRRQVLTRQLQASTAPRAARGGANVARCVVMDWNLGGGSVATVVAFEDGSTSLYFSSGGGIIGAGGHAEVKRAAAAFRRQAAADRARFAATTQFDLPPSGTSVFYLVTDSATLSTGPIANGELQEVTHPLAALAARAQDVITQVRRAG